MLSTCIGSSDLTPISGNSCISLYGWRTADRVKLSQVVRDPVNLANCDCTDAIVVESIDLDRASSEACSSTTVYWVDSNLYQLKMSAQRTIESGEWLNDEVMKAAQSLVLHQFPGMSGLESPVLQGTLSFQVHRNEFVQIVHVGDTHWCVVTNVGFEEGVVSVYDSMYPSVTEAMSRVIAR